MAGAANRNGISMSIKEYRERTPSESGFSVERRGGPLDGQRFRMVEATMDDGTKKWLFACNTHEGLFKQVFVPWDFQHPALIE